VRRLSLCAALVVISAACVTRPQATEPQFTFQSNFWVNLHHFIRVVARGMPAKAPLTADEQRAWDEAVAVYREKWAQRDLIRDDGMVAVKDTLRKVGNDSLPPEMKDEPELRATLLKVAPIYHKYWWPAHDTFHHSWIASVQPLLARYGDALSKRAAAAYGESWPSTPHPVDLTISAGPDGAYTSSPPAHSTIASVDPGYLGPAALEMLFHEASHQWGRRLFQKIDASAEARKKTVPRLLWHAVLFYNAGELTRRAYAEDGYGGYVEAAVKGKIYDDLCGGGCRERVAAAWKKRLDEGASIDEALDALVAAWPETK
jgi:hypothetical protein